MFNVRVTLVFKLMMMIIIIKYIQNVFHYKAHSEITTEHVVVPLLFKHYSLLLFVYDISIKKKLDLWKI